MKDEWRRAAVEGDRETISRLIGAGENVDARDRYGQTALMLAARNGRDQVVGALLECGADPDVTAKFGLSALMLAVINLHETTALRLVEAGAASELRGNGAPGFAGKTAADLAKARGLSDLAQRISGSGGDGASDT